MEKTKLQWHPGFCAALRITLGEDLDFLEIREEHLLGKKPLQIDALVLKKLQDRTVEKVIWKKQEASGLRDRRKGSIT